MWLESVKLKAGISANRELRGEPARSLARPSRMTEIWFSNGGSMRSIGWQEQGKSNAMQWATINKGFVDR